MLPCRLAQPTVILLVVLLMLYIWAGWSAVPFHGDEADHLFKSHDFLTYVVKGRPSQLIVTPPVQIDSPEHIRLLTGSTSAYLTGLALWLGGVYDWPPPWYYAYDVQWNLDNGRWPSSRILYLGRIPMAWLALLSIPLAYNIIWLVSKRRWAALVAASLLATHPAWLLSSRRVMQEAALGTLSLAVVWLGMLNAQHSTPKRRWGLGLVAGLCLATKPTAILTVGAILLALWLKLPPRWPWLGAGLLAVGVYLVLTPAIWGAPVQRVLLAAQLRAEVLEGQTQASPAAYRHWSEQAFAIVQQPFMSRLQYYESDAFEQVPRLDTQIAHYQHTGFAGWQMSPPIGVIMTMLAGVGMIGLWQRRNDPTAALLLLWMIVVALALGLGVPLAWQRYYLLWSLAACLAVGVGVCGWNRS